MKLDKLGWMIAAGMAGALVMSGFQGTNMKFATCDMEKAFNESNLTKENNDQLRIYGTKRFDILHFLGGNRAMTTTDVQAYADLSLLPKPTDAETARLSAISKSATADTQKQSDLTQKGTLTADDQKTLSDYHLRVQTNTDTIQKLEAKYEQDINDQRNKLKNDALDKVRKTVADISRKQGYSIVFNIDAAPYATNNLTDEIVKDINKS